MKKHDNLLITLDLKRADLSSLTFTTSLTIDAVDMKCVYNLQLKSPLISTNFTMLNATHSML